MAAGNNIQQPAFWLEVRKEYVLDNFDKLFTYLRGYNFLSDAKNDDFIRSLDCLEEVCDELYSQLGERNLYRNVVEPWGKDANRNIRIIATCILAQRNAGRSGLPLLEKLAGALLLSRDDAYEDLQENIRRTILCCARKKEIRQFGFSWGDIADESQFMLPVFITKFFMTSFVDGENETVGHEGKGLLLIKGDAVTIATQNWASLQKTEQRMQLELPMSGTVSVAKREYTNKRTAVDILPLCDNLMQTMNTMSPSPVERKKTYETGDQLVVEVLTTSPWTARSTDPKYVEVTGVVRIASGLWNFPDGVIQGYLQKGDRLCVTYNETGYYKFDMEKPFHNYYPIQGNRYRQTTCDAVYLGPHANGKGTRWYASHGLTVNTLSRTNRDIDTAIGNGSPVRIRIEEVVQDAKGKDVINGTFEYYDEPVSDLSGEDFISEARDNYIQDFLDYSAKQENHQLPASQLRDCGADIAVMLGGLYYVLSKTATGTEERCQCLAAAALLMNIAGRTSDISFLLHELSYEMSLIHFAKEDAANIPKTRTAGLNSDMTLSNKQEEIIAILRTYKDAAMPRSDKMNGYTKEDMDYLRSVINASNILNGKIGIAEVNRIKKNIASFLGVGDMFRNIYNDRTFYGEESDGLEFKSSAVFPADNNMQANPTAQMWAILKQVCGFLNSVAGGDLIIGVYDTGYSRGLEEDLQYLYQHHMIDSMTPDKLRLYLKLKIDNAFEDKQGMVSGMDITSTRVDYRIEHNQENDDVLHIRVSPYEYGIISFAGTLSRPSTVAESYYRTSGATVPMDKTLMEQVMDRKIKASGNENAIKLNKLRNANKLRKQVKLIGYSSSTSSEDRTIEPFQIMTSSRSVIGYDYKRKEVREFKVARAKDVEILDAGWKHSGKKKDFHVDIFDIMENDSNKPTHIKLKLGNQAKNLLAEEHPASKGFISNNRDADKSTYPWILDTTVYSFAGIGRFYLGLGQSIKIVEAPGLLEYVKDYFDKAVSKELK